MSFGARRWSIATGVTFFIVLVIGAFFAIDLEPRFRPSLEGIEPSPEALRIHHEAIVIDLHVDTLLWPRDLTRPAQGGHVDLDRMEEGGLDAAAFTISTGPFGLGGLKALHDGGAPRTWLSAWARLGHQLERMRGFVTASQGRMRFARDANSIRHHQRKGIISVFHGIEGAHALGKDVSRVEEVARSGVLFIAPVHLGPNAYGGSSLAWDRGLSELGRELIRKMNRHGVLVDLAHAGPRTFLQALALSALPPLVSHSGVRAVHDSWRNLGDDQIRAVAERGGVIGVMLAPPALRHSSLREAMAHLEHLVAIGGEDAAAIGSDFDGYVHTPVDASGLPHLTELMLRRGWTEQRIRKILGENVLRLLR